MKDSEKQIEELKGLPIKQHRLTSKSNDLRRQKELLYKVIEQLVSEVNLQE